mgnify:CR=1 FL=1
MRDVRLALSWALSACLALSLPNIPIVMSLLSSCSIFFVTEGQQLFNLTYIRGRGAVKPVAA